MKKAVRLLLFLFVIGLAALLIAGHSLCKPTNRPVPDLAGPEFQRVEIGGKDGRITIAWAAQGGNGMGFILAHGNSSDRNSMVPRMRYLHSLGYSVVAPDLIGNGETIGKRKTFGYLESLDIENSNRFIRNRFGLKWVGAIGSSLGGASILKAVSDGCELDAIIVESVFGDIRTAARNRLEMRFGGPGRYLEPLLTAQIPIWMGLSRDDISPIRWSRKCHAPILILSGSEDERAKPSESEAIFGQVPTARKRIKIIAGAKHQDLFAYDRERYLSEFNSFIQEAESGAGRSRVPVKLRALSQKEAR